MSAPPWPPRLFAAGGMAPSSRAIHPSACRISLSSRGAAPAWSSTTRRGGCVDGSPYTPAPSRARLPNTTATSNPTRSDASPASTSRIRIYITHLPRARWRLGLSWEARCSFEAALGRFYAVVDLRAAVDLRPTGVCLLGRHGDHRGPDGVLSTGEKPAGFCRALQPDPAGLPGTTVLRRAALAPAAAPVAAARPIRGPETLPGPA